ncbi:MAG: HAD family phosphatase [Lentisphaeria bacterium]|nr:HAD family phosphatase [Lentisphaeria bacterium]MDY0176847.1 HAD family phosphatase [Lentisphaeria bacterium]
MISGYIFDLDGTLIDSEGVWARCIYMALAAAGAELSHSDILALDFGRSWEELFQHIQARWPGYYQERQDMEAWMAPRFAEFTQGQDLCIPGSKKLLWRLLKQNLPVTIVSGSTRKQIQQGIERLGAEEHIRDYVSCEDVKAGKPDPEGFLKGAELLGLKPEKCLVFEDKFAGLSAAKAAGMRCVLLQRPGLPRQNSRGADLVLEDLADFRLQDL